MIDLFTIVPGGEFDTAVRRLEERLAADPGVFATRSGADTIFFLCGEEFVRRALRTQGRTDNSQLASVTVCASAGVLSVSTLGYEGSVAHLHEVLTWILSELGPCRVYDDASGDDISAVATRFPSTLLFPSEDAEEAPRAPESDVRRLRPKEPEHEEALSGMIDIPMPGVNSRRRVPAPAPKGFARTIDVPMPGVRPRH
jgi:hypothetical protein